MSLSRYGFQSDDGRDERRQEEEPPECGWLAEYEDAYDDGTDGSDARPDGIGGAYGERLRGLCQQYCTEDVERGEACNPCPPFVVCDGFGASEAIGEAYLAQAC